MTQIYSAEILIAATIYVRAATPEQAAQKILNMERHLELPAGEIGDGIHISGRSFDDPRLPSLSLSPVMTPYPCRYTGRPLYLEAPLTADDMEQVSS